ncbi:permease [Mobilitalea sibirica]|uniref:Permease n=1 Tax=Mobilitalea sibirica TaxID=1462919 RepID=A0A8J7L2K0_9FIRM|nr:permease [Mobilitalea sibirica]MBH1940793.1 permease [Mobilitalea sibirica]
MYIVEELYQLFYIIYTQFKLIFPFWITGLAIGSFISVFFAEKIAKIVEQINPKKFYLLGVLSAAILGAASPLCMYGTVPLIAVMGRKGTPQYFLVSFMVSSILINPNLFIYSFVLGVPIALLRLFFSILAGVCAGILVHYCYKGKVFFDFESFDGRKSLAKSHSLKGLLQDIHKAIQITAPYFFIGILLASLFEVFIPKMWIINLFGTNRELGVLLAVSLGVPIYVCGGGTIPLMRGWLNTGMSPGAVIAFALSGASTKLTNLSAVKIILGIKHFIAYIVFHMLFAILTGWLIDWIYRIF